MSERDRDREFLLFYEKYRIKDQLGYYNMRLEEFDRATGQGLFLSATILGLASGAGALAGTTVGWANGWAAVAAILSAASTTLAAYLALYAFEQQSKIYGDAARAAHAAARPVEADRVRRAATYHRRHHRYSRQREAGRSADRQTQGNRRCVARRAKRPQACGVFV